MSKYDGLNARNELEQAIATDLERAFVKRGFSVRHNGTSDRHAPAGIPDIEVFDQRYHVNVEVTTRMKSSAEGEFISIKSHLEDIKASNPNKRCFVIYVSPETHHRMISAMHDYNVLKKDSDDLKIMPICFSTFDMMISKFIASPSELYHKPEIMSLFSLFRDFLNDDNILKTISVALFSDDKNLLSSVAMKEENSHQKMVQDLIKDLKRLEDNLRKNGIATHNEAIRNVIYLVFMKLYEEKREYEGSFNRFSRKGFANYQENEGDREKAVHSLFRKIKSDGELSSSKTLTEFDMLAEKMTDAFVVTYFIEPFERYYFYTTKVDGLGAAYEVLGQLSGKDVKAGQFFTPENVVKTMVRMADLDSDDLVLDPACGTGRFLIYSMYDMMDKVSGANKEKKRQDIKNNQLFGSDFDSYVSKLAKMNMYIHQDGKANIQDRDGLLLDEFDKRITAILTNPPLGNLSYWLEDYNDDFRTVRMEVIPKRDGEVTGSETKGGALFLNAAFHYLKDVVNEDSRPEWKGGKLIIILDESLLNVDDYKLVRDFIKRHFYIKAIISLTKDTFVPVSKSANKTSILFAIKKKDPDAVQTEPVYFASIDRVGINTKRKVCDNHLFNNENQDLINSFIAYKNAVQQSYNNNHFSIKKFRAKVDVGVAQQIRGQSFYFVREFQEVGNNDRLDCRFFDPKYDEIKKYMQLDSVRTLKSVMQDDKCEYGVTESGLEEGETPFINIENLTEMGKINTCGIRFINDVPKHKLLSFGDLLISRSRLVGLASVVGEHEVGYTYGSYIIRFRLTNEVIPLFVAKFINSEKGKLQTELLKTGATGENINSNQLFMLAIPKLSIKEQEAVLEKMNEIEVEASEMQHRFHERLKQARSIMDSI